MRLITIPDQDGNTEHDLMFVIPPPMETQQAMEIVTAAVNKVKEDENYLFDDLVKELAPHGFMLPNFAVTTHVTW